MCARFLTTQLNCTHPDLAASLLELCRRGEDDEESRHYVSQKGADGVSKQKETYLEPADVKSPHRSELGWAAGTGEPKSKRVAGHGNE